MKNPEALGERLGAIVAKEMARRLEPLHQKIADLEGKSRDAMSYRGVYQRALSYRRGDCCTSDRTLWVCVRATDGAEGKPDEENTAWIVMTRG